MELPVSPDKLVPVVMQAVQHLPKLRRRKTAPQPERLRAYQAFSAAVWSAATAMGQAHSVAPFVTKPLVGVWWHTLMNRSVERNWHQTAEMLGALEHVRIVAPEEVRVKAEQVADCLGELATALNGPATTYEQL